MEERERTGIVQGEAGSPPKGNFSQEMRVRFWSGCFRSMPRKEEKERTGDGIKIGELMIAWDITSHERGLNARKDKKWKR